MATINPYIKIVGNCAEALVGMFTDKFGINCMVNCEKAKA